MLEQARRRAQRAQRQVPRAGGARSSPRPGSTGAVTIATNMAGRGTDIMLGDGVAELGGLHIIGTERHESRRIDNQLRGRSGRQGDPGSTRFYLSLEDDLMRVFGGERMQRMMDSPRHRRGRADRVRHRQPPDRGRPDAGRGPQLRHPQARPRVRRRHEQAARDHLRRAPQDPGGSRHPRQLPQHARERAGRGGAHLLRGPPPRHLGPGGVVGPGPPVHAARCSRRSARSTSTRWGTPCPRWSRPWSAS